MTALAKSWKCELEGLKEQLLEFPRTANVGMLLLDCIIILYITIRKS